MIRLLPALRPGTMSIQFGRLCVSSAIVPTIARATDSPTTEAAAPAAPVQGNIGGSTGSHEASALSEHLGKMMGDAPFCNLCGHTTVRNGVCYKCLNCGNTLGCS